MQNKDIRQLVLDKLEECGYRNIPGNFTTDGSENRFDSTGTHPEDPAEAFRIEELTDGRHAVIHCSHREPSLSGSCVIGADNDAQHYLQRKGIQNLPWGIRFSGSALVVPLICPETGIELTNQRIRPDGFKSFAKGKKMGAGYFIASTTAVDLKKSKKLFVAEGLATAMSVYTATDTPCIVAFSKGRMLKIARAVQLLAPEAKIVLALDKGVDEEIAREQRKHSTTFSCVTPTTESGTDFNDVHLEQGLESVKEQLKRKKTATLALHSTSESQRQTPSVSGSNDMSKLDKTYKSAENGNIFVPEDDPCHDYWIKDKSYIKNVEWFYKQHPERCIASFVYDPSKTPRSVHERGNTYAYNKYAAPQNRSGCPVKGSWLHELLLTGCRYEEDRLWLEQWIAWQVQRPGQLLECHPLLASAAQRTGKTTLANVVGEMIGTSNYKEVAPEDMVDRNSQHYATESTLLFIDEFNPSTFANPETSRIAKRMLTQKEVTAPKKYVNSYTAPRTANYIFATNRLQQLHYCEREERIKIILWREDRNFQYQHGTDLYDLSRDRDAVDWMRSHYSRYNIPEDLQLRRLTYNSPSDSIALSYTEDPYGDWLRSTNIDELYFLTNAEIQSKAQTQESRDLIGIVDFNNHIERDRFWKRVGSAMRRLGWHPFAPRKIEGKNQRGYHDISAEDWKEQERKPWVTKTDDCDRKVERRQPNASPLGPPSRPFGHHNA